MRDSIKDSNVISATVINKFMYVDDSPFVLMPTSVNEEIVSKIEKIIDLLSLGYNESVFELITSLKKAINNTVAENEKVKQMSNTVTSRAGGIKPWQL